MLNFVLSDDVEEIFYTFMNGSREELVNAAGKLSEMTPAPMKTVLEKQSREEALRKKEEGSKMVVKDVPPTTPGTSLQHLDKNTTLTFQHVQFNQMPFLFIVTDIMYFIVSFAGTRKKYPEEQGKEDPHMSRVQETIERP